MQKKEKESDLQKLVLDYLSHQPGLYWRQNQGGIVASYKGKSRFFRFASIKGIADIIGIKPPNGQMVALELKIKPNKPSLEQLEFIEMVKSHGGIAGVCYSLEDVIEILKD